MKDRPRAVILVTMEDEGQRVVTVLPSTRSPPSNPALAVEIPHETKRRLRLDDDRSWIVLTEANRFAWPGPDPRLAQPGNLESVAYGLLPRTLFKEVTARLGRCHLGTESGRGAENRVMEIGGCLKRIG